MSEIKLNEEAHAASRYAYMDVTDRGGPHSEALVAAITAYLTADPSYAAGRKAGLEEAARATRARSDRHREKGEYTAFYAVNDLEGDISALSQEPSS